MWQPLVDFFKKEKTEELSVIETTEDTYQEVCVLQQEMINEYKKMVEGLNRSIAFYEECYSRLKSSSEQTIGALVMMNQGKVIISPDTWELCRTGITIEIRDHEDKTISLELKANAEQN